MLHISSTIDYFVRLSSIHMLCAELTNCCEFDLKHYAVD